MNRPSMPATIAIINSSKVVKQKGQGWLIRCPAHHDTDPSLGVDEKDGKVLLDCFAGCTVDAIMQAIGLETKDLFASEEPKQKSTEYHETIYRITDTIEHVRKDYQDGSKDFTWRKDGKYGLQGTRTEALPLYGLWRIHDKDTKLAEGSGQTIILTEGEKASDSLWSRGYLSVATVTGAAGCPKAEQLTPLTLFVCYLWPDEDEPGLQHMEKVASRIPFGYCPFIIRVSGKKGADAADYKGDIGDLIGNAVIWEPGMLWKEATATSQGASLGQFF